MSPAKQKTDKLYYQISSLVNGLRVLELLAGKESLLILLPLMWFPARRLSGSIRPLEVARQFTPLRWAKQF